MGGGRGPPGGARAGLPSTSGLGLLGDPRALLERAGPAGPRLWRVGLERGRLRAPPGLREAYPAAAAAGGQAIVRVTCRVTGHQTVWNTARSLKPFGFGGIGREEREEQEAALLRGLEVPTETCDFCNWESRTAEDTFGRFENAGAVTASNLFKLAGGHGMVIFKRCHDPLTFALRDLEDVLEVSAQWFAAAAREGPSFPSHFFLVWNCLPRAGASQYHGHVQLFALERPLPGAALFNGAERYRAEHGADYFEDVREAAENLGLLHRFGDGAAAFPALAPVQDSEVVVHGKSLTDSGFVQALHHVLRTFVDGLGHTSFGLGVHLPPAEAGAGAPVVARVAHRGKIGSPSSDFGSLEVFGLASVGKADPWALSDLLGQRLARC